MRCVAAHGASASRDEDSKKLLPARRRRLRSRPASREGDNSSPFACFGRELSPSLETKRRITLRREGAAVHGRAPAAL